jgi:prepilin-type N-terminal cleavage/methylation domain-containing protein
MNKRAFTLIELIVVLFIIGISSSIVFLNVSRNQNIKGKKFTAYFVRLLQKARVESIINDKTTVLIINPEKRLISVNNSKKDSVSIPVDITITAEKIIEKDGKSYIYFFSNGSSSGMNINIYSNKFGEKILVNNVSGFIKTMDLDI